MYSTYSVPDCRESPPLPHSGPCATDFASSVHSSRLHFWTDQKAACNTQKFKSIIIPKQLVNMRNLIHWCGSTFFTLRGTFLAPHLASSGSGSKRPSILWVRANPDPESIIIMRERFLMTKIHLKSQNDGLVSILFFLFFSRKKKFWFLLKTLARQYFYNMYIDNDSKLWINNIW